MKKRNFFILFGLSLGLTAGMLSCSKEAVSKPKFIFKAAPKNGGLVAKFNGEEISEKELVKDIASELYEKELEVYRMKMDRLRGLMLERMMAKDPNKKGLSNDEFLEKYIAKDVKISDQDIANFVKERKIPKEHLNDQMNGRIRQFLSREKKKEAVDKWLDQKLADTPVEIYFAKPLRPSFDVRVGDAPFLGKENAKVTLVEFSDFQCPFCAKGAKILMDLKKKYGNDIKVVFKNFPLPFHNNAQIAAEAGLCVHEQDKGKFWKMHDLMFADQTKLDKAGLTASAKSLGVDIKKFEACLSSGKFKSNVQKDLDDGKNVGVRSTPTFFVNGKLVNGAQPIEVFSEIIDEELANN